MRLIACLFLIVLICLIAPSVCFGEKLAYRQSGALTKSNFQEIADDGFDGVIFNLLAQEAFANPEVFVISLEKASNIKTTAGKPLQIYAWINNVEANIVLMERIGEINDALAEAGSKNRVLIAMDKNSNDQKNLLDKKKICMDDEYTFKYMLGFYANTIAELAARMKERGLHIDGIYFDYELPNDFTCDGKPVNKDVRTKRVVTFFTYMRNAVNKRLGSDVKVYIAAPGIKQGCKSDLVGVKYDNLYKIGVLPAPFLFLKKIGSGAENEAAVTQKYIDYIKDCFVSMKEAHPALEVHEPACISSATVKSFNALQKQMSQIKLTYFEYFAMRERCPDVFNIIKSS